VAATRDETATARTIVLDVPGWPGHLSGQHVDVRLTAEDGYSTERSYSIASAPADGQADPPVVELTVQRLADGEVSPFFHDVAQTGMKSNSEARSAATSCGRAKLANPCS